MARRRTYESPLRAEQVDRTREKLLMAGVELVSQGGEDVTLRQVAAHAQVSVPTAYRYFPDRDSLHEAIAGAINAKVLAATQVVSAEQIPEWSRAIFKAFQENDTFMRAQLNTPIGREIRKKGQKARNQKVTEVVAASFPNASPAAIRRFAVLCRALVNINSWIMMHDDWGIDGDEAGDLVSWAITTMLAEAKRKPAVLEREGLAAARRAKK
jgi:AcrR family transcriptional regulator